MTISQLVRELAKREKLKKQIDISQVRELVGHLSDIFYESAEQDYEIELVITLFQNGEKRAQKKAKQEKSRRVK